jgi:hypothetical protein
LDILTPLQSFYSPFAIAIASQKQETKDLNNNKNYSPSFARSKKKSFGSPRFYSHFENQSFAEKGA